VIEPTFRSTGFHPNMSSRTLLKIEDAGDGIVRPNLELWKGLQAASGRSRPALQCR
jgi:hypothetical protein